MYLWWSSEVDDTIQLNVLAKLAVQPAMPVLVHSPLCLIHALALVQVGCKYVPGEQGKFTDKAFQKRKGLAGFSESLMLTLLLSSFKSQNVTMSLASNKVFYFLQSKVTVRNPNLSWQSTFECINSITTASLCSLLINFERALNRRKWPYKMSFCFVNQS